MPRRRPDCSWSMSYLVMGCPRGWCPTVTRDSHLNFWRALFEAMGSTLGMSMAYHPQTDGQTERINRVLEEALRAYVGALQTDWDMRLPMVQFAYNTAKHVSTGETTFFLNHGCHPVIPASLLAVPAAGSPVQQVPALMDFLQELRASMGVPSRLWRSPGNGTRLWRTRADKNNSIRLETGCCCQRPT